MGKTSDDEAIKWSRCQVTRQSRYTGGRPTGWLAAGNFVASLIWALASLIWALASLIWAAYRLAGSRELRRIALGVCLWVVALRSGQHEAVPRGNDQIFGKYEQCLFGVR